MVAAEAVASTAVVAGSVEADTSAEVRRARVMAAEARVLEPLEPIGAEPVAVPMELTDLGELAEPTEQGDPARMAAGHTVARLIARDTLARMVAGLEHRQRVHVMVQLLMAAQTQRRPREITALLELTLIVAQQQGTLRQQLRAHRAEWSLPIDQARL